MPESRLRGVRRGPGLAELVLIDQDGHAILLKGDGVHLEEQVAMAERAYRLLGGDHAA